ncbi:uncharacterized protein [Watersipora subatra]|uniref:uncharacterized protein n=1 Tax=Watersipora subatra TaxID=2589382 RepID=UPI00355BDCA4
MTEQAAKKINGSSSATFSQCSCSWKDDMIRFYREESITAWKCFLAASFERYLFLLSLHRFRKEFEGGMELVHISGAPELSPEEKGYLIAVIEEEKASSYSELIKDESCAGEKFISAMKSLDAGCSINGLPAIDPQADLQHFRALIEEGTIPMPDNTADVDELNLSFASSTYSEDSAFLSARSNFADLSLHERAALRSATTTPRRPVDNAKVKDDIEGKKHQEVKNVFGLKHERDRKRDRSGIGDGEVESNKEKESTEVVCHSTEKCKDENEIATDEILHGHKTGQGEGNSTISLGIQVQSEGPDEESSQCMGSAVNSHEKKSETAKEPPKAPAKKRKKKKKSKSGVKAVDGSETNQEGIVSSSSAATSNSLGHLDESTNLIKPLTQKDEEEEAQPTSISNEVSNGSKHSDQSSLQQTTNAAAAPSRKKSTASVGSAGTFGEHDTDKQIEDDEMFARELMMRWDNQDKKDQNKRSEDSSKAGRKAGVKAAVAPPPAPTVNKTIAPVDVPNGLPPHSVAVQPKSTPYVKIPELYKTSICWHYKDGFCPFGSGCKHAHGEKELRPFPDWFHRGPPPPQDTNTAHTEPCDNQQCPFRLAFYLRKTSMCEKWEAGKCWNTKAECRFAHGRGELKPLPKYEICQRSLRGKCRLPANECVYAHSPEELRTDKSKPLRPRLLVRAPSQAVNNRADQDKDMHEDCSICFEEFSVSRKRFLLKCGHNSFHKDCLEKWTKIDNSCPYCRNKVDFSQISDFSYRTKATDYFAF